jgi:hypothetical protein
MVGCLPCLRPLAQPHHVHALQGDCSQSDASVGTQPPTCVIRSTQTVVSGSQADTLWLDHLHFLVTPSAMQQSTSPPSPAASSAPGSDSSTSASSPSASPPTSSGATTAGSGSSGSGLPSTSPAPPSLPTSLPLSNARRLQSFRSIARAGAHGRALQQRHAGLHEVGDLQNRGPVRGSGRRRLLNAVSDATRTANADTSPAVVDFQMPQGKLWLTSVTLQRGGGGSGAQLSALRVRDGATVCMAGARTVCFGFFVCLFGGRFCLPLQLTDPRPLTPAACTLRS